MLNLKMEELANFESNVGSQMIEQNQIKRKSRQQFVFELNT